MAASHTKNSKLVISVISISIGYFLKHMLKKGWKKTYNEDPPGETLHEEINWGKLIIWTLLSGLILRLIKVGLKRTVALKLKHEDLLVD